MTQFNTLAAQAVLAAVTLHPRLMSPVLLEYLLRGEAIGRMAEKGLIGSTYHGALANLDMREVANAIGHCLDAGWIEPANKGQSFYPALTVTDFGKLAIASLAAEVAAAV